MTWEWVILIVCSEIFLGFLYVTTLAVKKVVKEDEHT
jgi:hypothetical protein